MSTLATVGGVAIGKEAGATGMEAFRQVAQFMITATQNSLIEFTKPTRVEPLVVVDHDVLNHDLTPIAMQTFQSLFAAYYLQAAALVCNVQRISTLKTLDKLNPNRDWKQSALHGTLLNALESYQDRLPFYADIPALEADGDSKTPKNSVTFNEDTYSTVQELSSLAVGKLLQVEIVDGDKKATVPVQLRLIPSTMPSTNLVHMLSLNNENELSIRERYHAWRSGRIQFVRDFVLCLDLMKAHRKNLMSDKDGVYSNIVTRNRSQMLSTIVSGDPSVATASNIVLISDLTALELETAVGGKLKDFKTREKIFAETSIMLLGVIDKQWERLTIYHRSIPEYSEYSKAELKASNKGNGPDVSEILKAYQVGAAPRI